MNKFSKFPAEVVCELHPLFRGLLWTSAARSTDETRPALCLLNVEKKDGIWLVVACDGRRLHLHTFDPGLFDDDIDMLEPGLYEVIAKSTKFIVLAPSQDFNATAYPNWRAVVPEFTPEREDSINAQTISRIGIHTGVLLAADFTRDAIGFGYGRKKDDTVTIEYGSKSKADPFVIVHDLGKAIVMPMKMHEGTEPAPESDIEATPELTGMKEADDAASISPFDILKNVMKPDDSVEVSVGGAVLHKFTKPTVETP
jgi:hypothetical protein